MTSTTCLQIESIKLAWGCVRHKRFLPKVNAFATQACFVRVRFSNAAKPHKKPGGLLQIDSPGLISLYGKDYGLEPHSRTLEEHATFLSHLIQKNALQNISGAVELHTFPRMFGYAFNPVSFWYFYNTQNVCTGILCEVSNTFGERHFYWLENNKGNAINQGQTLSATKNFHVSPFFPVSGKYQFRFMDAGQRSVARIDYFDQNKHQLTTSVSGTLMTPTTKLWAKTILKFGWFSFAVITKIHWQAVKLYFKKIKFHQKPIPPTQTTTKVNHHEQ